jgi:hypothetical protein
MAAPCHHNNLFMSSMPTLHRIAAAAALLAMTCSAEAAADDARLRQLEQRLEQSLTVIDQLQRRVQELEQRPGPAGVAAPAAAPAPVAAAPSDPTPRIEALERTVNDISTAATRPADTGVPLHGFLDVAWAKSGRNAPASTADGFRLGTFDLYLTPQLSDRVKALVELAFETDDSGSLATDLERLQLGYVFNDALTLWGGRFHTPYGYWNTAYHHGAQIQTSVTRPRFLAFEDQGGILPAHSVGLWATGRWRTGLGRWTYDVYAVNGDKIDNGVLNFNAAGDDNTGMGTGVNVSLSPNALPGLTLGVHGLRQRVEGTSSAAATGRARLRTLGGYGYFESDRWEVLGEYYRFVNTDLTNGANHRSWAGYVQAGYHLDERWTTYLRAERTGLNAFDPYFVLQDSGRSYRRQVGGLRFEVDPRTAVKVELDRMNDEANPLGAFNTMRAQYAVRF